MYDLNRVVCWFSCGATSAVASKIALDKYSGKYPVEIVYTDTGGEHRDNVRFIKDCEKWFNHSIRILKNPKFRDIWDVWEKTRYLVGPTGARCTAELKRKVRESFECIWGDIQIFGFSWEEQKRSNLFQKNNPEVFLETPLIERKLSKQYCIDLLKTEGIELPAMYRLGYRNNNCIGCVKGQMGYWNKIRVDFPAVFARMAILEQELNIAINRVKRPTGPREKVFLKDLHPDRGRYNSELDIDCGVLCFGLENERYQK